MAMKNTTLASSATAFSTFNHSRASTFTILSGCLVAAGGILTGFVYYIMLRSKAFRKAPYMLIFSLGLNDVLNLVTHVWQVLLHVNPGSQGSEKFIRWQGAPGLALWFNLDMHLLVIALNRVVYTIFPKYKEVLFAKGKRVFLWICLCWVVTTLIMILHAFPDTRSGMQWYPERCVIYLGFNEKAYNFWKLFSMLVQVITVLFVFLLYVAVGIKSILVVRALHPITMKEVRFNIQQGIVFTAFLLAVTLFNINGVIPRDALSPDDRCALGYFLVFMGLINFLINPAIYLVFNKELQKEVKRFFGARTPTVQTVQVGSSNFHVSTR